MSTVSPSGPLLGNSDWRRLRAWFGLRGRHGLPWRRERSPWRVLLAETLLHRTRADAVAGVYPVAASRFPSPQTVVDHPQLWRELTRPLGLAWRVETFIGACSKLVQEHAGRVPGELAALERLPGIGHYAANAVICFGFGRRAVIVDTNTIRLAARISGERLEPSRHRSRAVREAVARLGPNGQPPGADDNFALLDLAALVCTPRAPHCTVCPLAESCVTGGSILNETGRRSGN